MLPEEGFYYWCDYILQRCQQDYDSCVIFSGETGSGKSTLALQMARTIDEDFDLRTDLCYTASALKEIYKQRSEHPESSRGRVVVFDEGVRGLLAGDQATEEQKDTVKMLALVRALNVPLFICVPDIWRLAKAIRANRAALWIHVVKRGHAIIHVRRSRIQYNPDNSLGFDISAVCPYLRWDKFDDTDPFWQLYTTVKMRRLNEYFHEKDQKKKGHGHTSEQADEEHDDAMRETAKEMLAEGQTWRQVREKTGLHNDAIAALKREMDAEAPRVVSTSTADEKPKRKASAAGLRNWQRKQQRNARAEALAARQKTFQQTGEMSLAPAQRERQWVKPARTP